MLPFLRFYESFVVHYDFKSCRDQLNGFKKGYNKVVSDHLSLDFNLHHNDFSPLNICLFEDQHQEHQ